MFASSKTPQTKATASTVDKLTNRLVQIEFDMVFPMENPQAKLLQHYCLDSHVCSLFLGEAELCCRCQDHLNGHRCLAKGSDVHKGAQEHHEPQSHQSRCRTEKIWQKSEEKNKHLITSQLTIQNLFLPGIWLNSFLDLTGDELWPNKPMFPGRSGWQSKRSIMPAETLSESFDDAHQFSSKQPIRYHHVTIT